MSNFPAFGHARRGDFLLADGVDHLNHGGYGGTPRIVLDASNAKPGVGQPVDFEARIVGSKTKVDDARFLISGPGIAPGTELPAADDGSGTFRTTSSAGATSTRSSSSVRACTRASGCRPSRRSRSRRH